MSTRRRRSIFEIISEYYDSLEEMAEQIEETLFERPSWNQKACTIEPLRDVTVTPKEVIVTVDLPYTEENTVQVKPLSKNTIEISAEMRRKIRFDDFGITHYKGEFQKFHCQTRIPVPVFMEKMEVQFKRGILEIHLPRKHEHTISME
ncbi:MAG: Hsp20/alpha crystallin family protein [Candidatus Bathyarchaeota archaeon]|nr:Hsp20/alpha crystallin family protein [Candidatus Bathyarchaeota archaeon]MDH5787856.1 Hsp20/alpha crystallin family protein [Candidatus Bathyarchaeota archaeon]